jgi:hypothetical protein
MITLTRRHISLRLPFRPRQASWVADVQCPYVIQSRLTVATTEDDEIVKVENGTMCSPGRWPPRAGGRYVGFTPFVGGWEESSGWRFVSVGFLPSLQLGAAHSLVSNAHTSLLYCAPSPPPKTYRSFPTRVVECARSLGSFSPDALTTDQPRVSAG